MRLEYLHIDSPIHRLYPMTSLMLLIWVIATSLLVKWTYASLLIIVCWLVPLVIVAKVSRELIRLITIPLMAGIFVFIMQSLFYPSESEPIIRLGSFFITVESFSRGVRYSTRLIIIFISSFLFILTTHPGTLLTVLESKGLPRKLSYTLYTSFQMLPDFQHRVRTIFDALKSKGIITTKNPVSRIRVLKSSLYNFFMSLVYSVPEREPTPLVRGFNWRTTKTSMIKINDSISQSFIRKTLILSILLFAIVRIVR